VVWKVAVWVGIDMPSFFHSNRERTEFIQSAGFVRAGVHAKM